MHLLFPGRSYVMYKATKEDVAVKALIIGKAYRPTGMKYHLLISNIKRGKETGTIRVYDVEQECIQPI